jgi:putative phage-type endonuclease
MAHLTAQYTPNPASSPTQALTHPLPTDPSPRRYRDQAQRLIETRTLDRASWLAVRRTGIGSSDAAAAVGLHPYQSSLALWLEKTGRAEPESEPRGEALLSSPLHWGQVLEPIIAEHYARHTGHRVRRVNAILQHVEHPWMLANLDREVIGDDAVQILECKSTGLHGARVWNDGVPEYVQLQVMHQLAVTGQHAADVAVLLAGHALQIHRIERDEAMIAALIALERQFWQRVVEDRAPPADGSDSAGRALRVLLAQDDGTQRDFSADPTLNQAFADLQRVRQGLDDLHQQEARLKQQLQQAMGAATEAVFATGRVRWKQSAASQRLDTQALQQDHPDLYRRYLKSVPSSRRFLVRD